MSAASLGLVSAVRCFACGEAAEAPASAATCSACGGILEVEFDMDRVRESMTPESVAARPQNHWRYHELLPVDEDPIAFRWPVGMTPIAATDRLANWVGTQRLRIKDDGRNPTSSFKDRASSLGVLHAFQTGATRVACASTGNAASSLAGYAAMAGLPATIFVPERAPEPKVTQLLMYGAEVCRVRGTYSQAYDLCTAECEANDWYNRNAAINPYLVEGKKTCGLEIAEQTAGDVPDWVAVSVGDGCTIAGIAKGLSEMHALGFIDRLPRLLGVQAAGMDPVAQAFEAGSLPKDFAGETLADSIDVPTPRNWLKATRRVAELDGKFVRVTDDEITDAMLACGRLAGVFAEPAAAASVAGVRRAVADGTLGPDSDVLAVVTGSGLKDIRTAMGIAGKPTEVMPLE